MPTKSNLGLCKAKLDDCYKSQKKKHDRNFTSDQTTCVLYASQSPALSLSEVQTVNLVLFR